jgi:hypothetical protein
MQAQHADGATNSGKLRHRLLPVTASLLRRYTYHAGDVLQKPYNG